MIHLKDRFYLLCPGDDENVHDVNFYFHHDNCKTSSYEHARTMAYLFDFMACWNCNGYIPKEAIKKARFIIGDRNATIS